MIDPRQLLVAMRTDEMHPAVQMMVTCKGRCEDCGAAVTVEEQLVDKMPTHKLICYHCFAPVVQANPGMLVNIHHMAETHRRAVRAIQAYEAQKN